MVIELMACMGCQRVVDQFVFPPKCPRCSSKFHKAIAPTYFNIIRWFLTHPRHVIKLLIEDMKERRNDK